MEGEGRCAGGVYAPPRDMQDDLDAVRRHSFLPSPRLRARGLIKFLTTPKKHPGAGVTTTKDIGEKAK